MTEPRQGEIWWAEAEDKRRPVLVVTRSEAIPVLRWVVVAAPGSRTVRGIPTEIPLGTDDGLDEESAASFDNLQPIRRASPTERAGYLGMRRYEICRGVSRPGGLRTIARVRSSVL